MGFDLQTLRFVLAAKCAGADFTDTLTLGHQSAPDRAVYRREAKRYGLPVDQLAIENAYAAEPYVDGILRGLGSSHPRAMDASDYEGADVLADLNKPIPKDLEGRFSLVIDAGTTEHVFDVRQVFANVGKLLKVEGTVLSINGANNFTGHGFYQFSPELLFRVFCEANGFVVESMVFTETNDDGEWYEIADPAKVNSRVELRNCAPTYLMMRARKVADVEMFQAAPQQSDYDQNWAASAADRSYTPFGWKQQLAKRFLPSAARRIARRLSHAGRRSFASPYLSKVDLPAE
jgi:hypothetical protein